MHMGRLSCPVLDKFSTQMLPRLLNAFLSVTAFAYCNTASYVVKRLKEKLLGLKYVLRPIIARNS